METSNDFSLALPYLTPACATFSERNGFLSLHLSDGAQQEDGRPRDYPRVLLHRSFPFEFAEAYISVLDPEQKEIGMIREISLFPEEQAQALRRELARRYYAPKIVRIHQVKERFGFSHWRVSTEEGPLTFTLKDTYRSLLRISDTRLLVTDVNGNRYEIPDTEALPRRDFRRIELYL